MMGLRYDRVHGWAVESVTARLGPPWLALGLQARTEAVRLGAAGGGYILRGRGGLATDTVQRLETGGAVAGQQLAPLGRRRAGPTPAVELILRGAAADADPLRFTLMLPEGVGGRRGCAAVSRRIASTGGGVEERDVIVVGGLDAVCEALDEALIFSLSPSTPR